MVRELAARGVDVIKIMATGGVLDPGAMGFEQHFTDAEMKAIVEMAHRCISKSQPTPMARAASKRPRRPGVDSIEHGTFLDAGARR